MQLVVGIMRISSANLFLLWTRGSVVDIVKRYFLFTVVVALCLAERNQLCNFGRLAL